MNPDMKVQSFVAPLPPGVRKVKVKHRFGSKRGVYFEIRNSENLFMVAEYMYKLYPDFISFTFADPLPEGIRIVVFQ